MSAMNDDPYSDYYTGQWRGKKKPQSVVERLKELKSENYELKNEIILFRANQKFEELMRESHPPLQNVWEQYQIMLNLIRK